MAIWIFTIMLFLLCASCWLYWMHKASQQHLQMRNGAHHLKMQNEIIATRRRLWQLEMESQQQ